MSFLSDQERQYLKSYHRAERDKRVCDRIKAVLWYDRGWSIPEIAEALFLSDDAIRKHIQEYRATQKLKPNNGGSYEKLSEYQSRFLEKHLEKTTYQKVCSIVNYVCSKWKVKYSVAGLTSWLRRKGFTYKKPKIVPGKADSKKQEKWIKEYKKLRENLPADETICFIDSLHPTHNVQLSYGWIRKGTERVLPSNTGRKRINITGALDITSYKVFYQEDVTVNAQSTLNFFEKLEGFYSQKKVIHLFCDNARYFRNKQVTEYLKNSRIKLHFLPPYSPNLNPIERLWKWMKESVIYNLYYEEFSGFKKAIFGFFEMLNFACSKSTLIKKFRSRVKDSFRVLQAPMQNYI